MRAASFMGLLVALLVILAPAASCKAGMPAVLPTNWTADSPRPSWAGSSSGANSGEAQFQAISFFLACVFLSAWVVKGLWNSVRRDFSALPELGYRRALSLVVLWGLCFVIVLTMISGARELMTPGAWKKQGWTYALAEAKTADVPDLRRQGLERLRFSLWQYAALHEGKFPPETDLSVDQEFWQVPGCAGLRYLYVPDQSVDQAGRLLVFEPSLNDDDRLVLLTNGLLGSMRSPEIERQISGPVAP